MSIEKKYNMVKASEVTLDTEITELVLFNPEPTVCNSSAAPIGSNVDGIIDTSVGPQWAMKLWDVMRSNDWFPAEADTSSDGAEYVKLDEAHKRAYDLAISSLIYNDSVQTRNLANNMIPYITDGKIVMVLTRQAFEEANHTISYSVLLTDVSPNKDEIYELYRKDEFLKERNQYLDELYGELAYSKGEKTTVRILIRAMIANNILESIMFYAGFVFFWYLGIRMPGTAKMISFIARDERTHVVLFRQLLKSTLKSYPGIDKGEVEQMLREEVHKATENEKRWLKYFTGGKIAEFSEKAISAYIEDKANQITEGFGFNKIYPKIGYNPLMAFEKAYDKPNEQKTNQLEMNPTTYDVRTLPMEDYLEGGEI